MPSRGASSVVCDCSEGTSGGIVIAVSLDVEGTGAGGVSSVLLLIVASAATAGSTGARGGDPEI